MDFAYKQEKPEYVPKFTEFPGTLRVMQDWVDTYIKPEESVHRPKSLIVWGPSRMGKTEWARSLGRHTYFQGMFNLDVLDEDADYVVMDDIPPKYFGSYKQWMGGQRDFNVTDKYRKKKQVAGGWPCIILMNTDPREVAEWDQAWVAKNAVFVYLNHEMWHPAPDGANGEYERPPVPEDIVYLEDVMDIRSVGRRPRNN